MPNDALSIFAQVRLTKRHARLRWSRHETIDQPSKWFRLSVMDWGSERLGALQVLNSSPLFSFLVCAPVTALIAQLNRITHSSTALNRAPFVCSNQSICFEVTDSVRCWAHPWWAPRRVKAGRGFTKGLEHVDCSVLGGVTTEWSRATWRLDAA